MKANEICNNKNANASTSLSGSLASARTQHHKESECENNIIYFIYQIYFKSVLSN